VSMWWQVKRKAVRVAGYWHLGAWVVGHGDVQSGPVDLQASESVLSSWLSGDAWGGPVELQLSEFVWAVSCLERCGVFWWGCRRVSPPGQLVVQRWIVGCVYSCW
jgi:hypothetical protein